jgi:hypothetical protein
MYRTTAHNVMTDDNTVELTYTYNGKTHTTYDALSDWVTILDDA